MNIRVPEELLKLDDPYDPQKRPPGVGLHDASYYHGRYCLYFGAAPVVTLMLPFQLLTGMDLPARAAGIVFVYAGFLAGAGIWLLIRRRAGQVCLALTSAMMILAVTARVPTAPGVCRHASMNPEYTCQPRG
jgi:hypothetical protein